MIGLGEIAMDKCRKRIE
jgi:hypothetical protein